MVGRNGSSKQQLSVYVCVILTIAATGASRKGLGGKRNSCNCEIFCYFIPALEKKRSLEGGDGWSWGKQKQPGRSLHWKNIYTFRSLFPLFHEISSVATSVSVWNQAKLYILQTHAFCCSRRHIGLVWKGDNPSTGGIMWRVSLPMEKKGRERIKNPKLLRKNTTSGCGAELEGHTHFEINNESPQIFCRLN